MTRRTEPNFGLRLSASRGFNVALRLSVVALAACGGHPPEAFADGSSHAPAGDDAENPNEGFADDDAGNFGGGASAPTGPCVPGTYRGTFNCDISLLVFFKVPLQGPIAFTFAGEQTGSGEFTSLSIAKGAKMNAKDDKGDVFTADLAGSLDCTTNQLTGTMTNATMAIGDGWAPGVNPFTGKTIRFAGDLRAGYDGAGTPPAIENGVMNLNSPDLGGDAGPTGACGWKATLNGPLPEAGALDDAGAASDAAVASDATAD